MRELHAGGKSLVTPFLCPKDTPKGGLKALYRRRWQVELDVRNIKTTLACNSYAAAPPGWRRRRCGSTCWPTL